MSPLLKYKIMKVDLLRVLVFRFILEILELEGNEKVDKIVKFYEKESINNRIRY